VNINEVTKTLALCKHAVMALVFLIYWRKPNAAVRLAANVTVALSSVALAIADAAVFGDGWALGWIFNALLYAYSSAGAYWEVFHEEADQESKLAWREWRWGQR
jgi:hypothetical protein